MFKLNHEDLEKKPKKLNGDKKDLRQDLREAKKRIKELDGDKMGMGPKQEKITYLTGLLDGFFLVRHQVLERYP